MRRDTNLRRHRSGTIRSRADGKTHVLKGYLEDDALEAARDAVERCPTQSLRIVA